MSRKINRDLSKVQARCFSGAISLVFFGFSVYAAILNHKNGIDAFPWWTVFGMTTLFLFACAGMAWLKKQGGPIDPNAEGR